MRRDLFVSVLLAALAATVLPVAKQGASCPSGFHSSGGFCAPTSATSRPAVVKPPGTSCPSGWTTSGGAYCVKN